MAYLRVVWECWLMFWAQCYKTFYVWNLRMFVISKIVCLLQAFPANSNVCGWGQELTFESSTWKVLHSGKLRLTHKQQTRLDRLARDKHSSLLQTFVYTNIKGFIALGPDRRNSWKKIKFKKCNKKLLISDKIWTRSSQHDSPL